MIRKLTAEEKEKFLNGASIHDHLEALQTDLEVLDDEDLLKVRDIMLERVNRCLELSETNKDNSKNTEETTSETPNHPDESPIFSDRMTKIAAKAQRDREKQEEKERKEQQELTEAMRKIKDLAPRINILLNLANACKKENIEFPTDTGKFGYGYYNGRRGYNFLADGIEHHVGFMGRGSKADIQYIGIYNGGYNGPFDFYVDGYGRCYKRRNGDRKASLLAADRIQDMLKFLEEFDAFEQAVGNWIDSFNIEAKVETILDCIFAED